MPWDDVLFFEKIGYDHGAQGLYKYSPLSRMEDISTEGCDGEISVKARSLREPRTSSIDASVGGVAQCTGIRNGCCRLASIEHEPCGG